ncbi:MAG: dihydroorotate dehydrogenase electron transfer subunit [Bradymonadales bacterium]|nr:dihydroorotate dehydrogenase electron transfer subunit [Bradymonadales bacterium]
MGDAMRTVRVKAIVEHGPGLKSFLLDGPIESAAPGQFVMLWLPGIDEKPFSISDLGEAGLEISVKAVGPFTRALMEVSVGDYLGIRGPFGKGFRLADRTLLVGGGIGVAPLRFLYREMGRLRLSAWLVVGVRTAADLIFPDYFRSLPDCLIVSEDGSIGETGIVTDVIDRIIDQAGTTRLAAAGPEPMLVALRDLGERRGLKVELDLERYMKCGIGLCGLCCVDGSGVRLCVEGPVLSSAELRGVTDLGRPHRDATGRRRCGPD